MSYTADRLIVATTIYPGVEPYLRDWYASVAQQADRDFSLWIALDGLSADAVGQAIGSLPDAVWVQAEAGETPAAIRQRLLTPIVAQCDGVVLVDSDDLLHPGRVAAARAGLERYELTGCALRLVDQSGGDLGQAFTLPATVAVETVLPRHNVFGLSNTAWRSDLLRRCLPVSSDIEIVDWFLATRAWLLGADMSFDPVVGMDYRQHASNMVRVCAPFSTAQVVRDTQRACHHFQRVLAQPPAGTIASRLQTLARVAEEVEQFAVQIRLHPALLEKYIIALNALELAPMWWSSVAHPSLKQLWSNQG